MPVSLVNPILTTRSQIEYYERPDGYKESNQDDNCFVARRLACLWSQRKDFMRDILGEAHLVSGLIQRDLPEPDLEFGDDGFYAQSAVLVNGEGVPLRADTHNGLAYFDRSERADTATADGPDNWSDGFAVYDVTFRKPLYQLLTDDDIAANDEGELARWTFTSRDPSVENLPIPGTFLKFKDISPDEPIPQAGVIIFPKTVIRVTWYEVPLNAVPFDTIENLVGTVSDDVFLGKDAGTLLMLPPQQRPYQSRLGQTMDEISFLYEYRPQGYNKFLRSASAGFAEVVRTHDASKGVFETGSFLDAFDPSLP